MILGRGLNATAKEAGDPGARRFIALPAAAGIGHSTMEVTIGSADDASADGCLGSVALAGEAPVMAIEDEPDGTIVMKPSGGTPDVITRKVSATPVGILVADATSPA